MKDPANLDDDSARIGAVAAIDANQVVIRLDPQVGGLVKATPFGVLPVGGVNSFVCIPVAHYKVVARVDRIQIQEPRGSRQDEDPDASVDRIIEATIIGRIEGSRFDAGLSAYPALFAPAFAATDTDLDQVIGFRGEHPLRIGVAPAANDRPVLLDSNKLLARHTLVVGTTGAGKSCTVMALLDGLLEQRLPSANIVVFDTNGEYKSAFEENPERAELANCLTFGPETGSELGLLAPHWLMTAEEHMSLLRAGEGIQGPLLQRAIADARFASDNAGSERIRVQSVSYVLSVIRAIMGGLQSKKPQDPLVSQLSSLHAMALEFSAANAQASHWSRIAELLSDWTSIGLNQASWDPPNAHQMSALAELVEGVEEALRDGLNKLGLGTASSGYDFDAPLPYSLQELADRYLPARVALESRLDPRLPQYMTGLTMRLSRLLADSRYDFVTRVPAFDRSLARFLRLMLGWGPINQREQEDQAPWHDSLSTRGATSNSRHRVIVLDLSLVASDVLDDVTALLGRVAFDLMLRVKPRASMPMVLVLEEAHRYVPSHDGGGSRRRSAEVFERIAKEGRKFGLSLLLATQRPSELSATVASQCGTLIAHRLSNSADQDTLRYASPYSSKSMLGQLAGLAQQHALIVGDAIGTSTVVRIRDVPNAPHGLDPDFVALWSRPDFDGGELIDAVAEDWQPAAATPAADPDLASPVAPEAGPTTGATMDDPPF